MRKSNDTAPEEIKKRIRWLMFCRVLFTTLLLGSTIILQLRHSSPFARALLALYALIVGIFILSGIYRLFLNHIQNWFFFGYIQNIIDTFIVTLIIFMTGGYSSLFSFLYLVVIIYASMLLFRKGSIIMASLCSIQYGVLVDLEYYGILMPFGLDSTFVSVDYSGVNVLYRVIITMVACFAVAFLSGLLSEQERRSKKELQAMGDHVKRVEKMAAIGEMAAGLAHEIKNPIASLRGSIQLLRDELKCDSNNDKLMAIILRETDRLSSLVNDFLMFARPPVARVEKVEVFRAINDSLELFRRDTGVCMGISIETEIPENVWINVDPSHFRQIMWNLLLNAAEAMDEGGTIRVEAKPTKSRFVVVKVSDTGKGITRDNLKSIFDPFFTTKPRGTGLGLSIVHRIMEAYEGWIDIDSEAGSGTTFSLIFKRSVD